MRNLPSLEVVYIVAQIHSDEVDVLVGRVIKFYPTVEINGGADDISHVGSHQFINDDNG
jgi:hypothetical protein